MVPSNLHFTLALLRQSNPQTACDSKHPDVRISASLCSEVGKLNSLQIRHLEKFLFDSRWNQVCFDFKLEPTQPCCELASEGCASESSHLTHFSNLGFLSKIYNLVRFQDLVSEHFSYQVHYRDQ